jgi:TonB family protein
VLDWVPNPQTLLADRVFVYPPGAASGRPGTLTVLSDGINVDAQPVRAGRWQFWKIASMTYERYSGGLGFVSIRFDPALSGAPELRLKPQDGDTAAFFSRLRNAFENWSTSDLGGQQLATARKPVATVSVVDREPQRSGAPVVAPPTPPNPSDPVLETYEVAHRHGFGGLLADVLREMNAGNASPNFCIGVLELFNDRFRFHTTATRDNRRDDVTFAYTDVKKVERKNPNWLHVDTVKNNWDFFGEPDVINRMERTFSSKLEAARPVVTREQDSSPNIQPEQRAARKDEKTYDLNDVEEKPVLNARIEPPKSIGAQQTIVLSVQVLADGTVGDIRVLRHAQNRDWENDALAVVRQWKFKPATRKGQSVNCWFNVGVTSS